MCIVSWGDSAVPSSDSPTIIQQFGRKRESQGNPSRKFGDLSDDDESDDVNDPDFIEQDDSYDCPVLISSESENEIDQEELDEIIATGESCNNDRIVLESETRLSAELNTEREERHGGNRRLYGGLLNLLENEIAPLTNTSTSFSSSTTSTSHPIVTPGVDADCENGEVEMSDYYSQWTLPLSANPSLHWTKNPGVDADSEFGETETDVPPQTTLPPSASPGVDADLVYGEEQENEFAEWCNIHYAPIQTVMDPESTDKRISVTVSRSEEETSEGEWDHYRSSDSADEPTDGPLDHLGAIQLYPGNDGAQDDSDEVEELDYRESNPPAFLSSAYPCVTGRRNHYVGGGFGSVQNIPLYSLAFQPRPEDPDRDIEVMKLHLKITGLERDNLSLSKKCVELEASKKRINIARAKENAIRKNLADQLAILTSAVAVLAEKCESLSSSNQSSSAARSMENDCRLDLTKELIALREVVELEKRGREKFEENMRSALEALSANLAPVVPAPPPHIAPVTAEVVHSAQVAPGGKGKARSQSQGGWPTKAANLLQANRPAALTTTTTHAQALARGESHPPGGGRNPKATRRPSPPKQGESQTELFIPTGGGRSWEDVPNLEEARRIGASVLLVFSNPKDADEALATATSWNRGLVVRRGLSKRSLAERRSSYRFDIAANMDRRDGRRPPQLDRLRNRYEPLSQASGRSRR